MKLIVGLGNPGRQYAETRHNIGFHVVAELVRRGGAAPSRVRFQGEWSEVPLGRPAVGGQACGLLRPQTYMNRSGQSVLAARDFYKVDNADLLVVCDDFALPLGTIRVRTKGSSGGQKGLQDILQRLGTEEIPRLRLGIGPVPEKWDPADFVLARFAAAEIPLVNEAIIRGADAVECWVRDGIQICMNRYNTSPSAREGDGNTGGIKGD